MYEKWVGGKTVQKKTPQDVGREAARVIKQAEGRKAAARKEYERENKEFAARMDRQRADRRERLTRGR